jgi:hypothetical protein
MLDAAKSLAVWKCLGLADAEVRGVTFTRLQQFVHSDDSLE